MKTRIDCLFVLCLFIFAVGFSGCELLEGGMSSVPPPALSETHETPPESILKDLSPIRPRDMMISENESKSEK